jgi:O-antigen/teichoic acid export membrane protein
MTLSLSGRLAIQAATFVLVARALGAGGFGAFAAALALVSVVAPFAALGAGNLLVMHVARGPQSFERYWGSVLVTVPLAGVPLTVLAVGSGALLLPLVPVTLILTLAMAEFFFARIAELCSQAFQGLDRMRPTALVGALPSFFRLGAAAAFVSVAGARSPTAWGVCYLVASAIGATVAFAVVTVSLGRPVPDRALVRQNCREGPWFALGQSSSNIYTDIDKTLLARLATLPAAGVYTAAYRVTAMAFVPMTGLLVATYARFFRRGAEGISGSRRLAAELMPLACLYGLGAGVALYAIAPVLPHLLGRDFSTATGVVRWLAPLPLIQAAFYLGGDALTGAGYQRTRTVLQAGAAILNVCLCFWLIPGHSWRGAAWATLGSLGFLAAAMWVAVLVISARGQRDNDAALYREAAA